MVVPKETGTRELAGFVMGLALVAGLTGFAFSVGGLPGLALFGPLVLALLAGAAVRAVVSARARDAERGSTWLDHAQPGVRFAAKVLLRVGIVFLGVRLDLRALLGVGPTVLAGSVLGVLVAFITVEWLGGRLGVDRGLRRAVAVGTGVCGATAIAAAVPVLRAEDEHASLAITVVSVLGTVGVVMFALWDALAAGSARLVAMVAGASLQEVGHVVAAGAVVGGTEGDLALLIKLSRVVLLAPALMLLGWLVRREAKAAAPSAGGVAKLPPLVPPFVLGFLGFSAVTSLGWLSVGAVGQLTLLGTVLTAAAMAGIGLGVHFGPLRRSGGKAVLLGVAGFVAMVVVMGAYYGITLS